MTPKQFQSAVLSFYKSHGRKHLPWQQDKTHYKVWISEVMLQQTQVATVIPYYEKFMLKFPDIQSLATAHEDTVLALWTGLGYYTRARNLHKCAIQIVNDFSGIWPRTVKELEALPGIGRSTAGAILSLTTGQTETILDGNVKRVLSRYFAIEGWPGKSSVHNKLWELAESLTSPKNTDHYNQAMMDIGATICTRTKPSCKLCPISSGCKALQLGTPTQFPGSKPKKVKPVRSTRLYIFEYKNSFLLRKNQSSGVWAKLWSLPDAESLSEGLYSQILIKQKDELELPIFRHTFSHFHLDIQPVWIKLKSRPNLVMDSLSHRWQDRSELSELGMPAPILKLLTQGKIE